MEAVGEVESENSHSLGQRKLMFELESARATKQLKPSKMHHWNLAGERCFHDSPCQLGGELIMGNKNLPLARNGETFTE